MDSLLIIFVKNPEIGKVKSRLAKIIGAEKALFVYKKLLIKTKEIVANISVEKLVCYSDKISAGDLWENSSFQKTLQRGDDLGDKMYNAFHDAVEQSYRKICLIGSDNMEITADIIKEAFHQLDDQDIVLGPAIDGGYYLIAMKFPYREIFKNKEWGSDSVLKNTIDDIQKLNLKYSLLPELNDIDVFEDINEKDRDFLFN